MSEFLANTLDDITKQCDIARSARFFTHRRRPKYFIKDELIIETLKNARYTTNNEISDLITTLGHIIQGYVNRLREYNVIETEDESD